MTSTNKCFKIYHKSGFSDYTKEYFGIVQGINETEKKRFIEVFRREQEEWKKLKFQRPKELVQEIDDFIHKEYFKFNFDTRAIGATSELIENLSLSNDKNRENDKSIGNVLVVMKTNESSIDTVEIMDYFRCNDDRGFYLQVIEPLYVQSLKDKRKKREEEER